MPALQLTPDSLEFLNDLLMAEPALTLKLQGLLNNYGYGVERVLVDNLDAPSALIVKSGAFHSFFGYDVDAAVRLLDELSWGEPLAFSGVWEPLVELIAERAEVLWRNPCTQYHLPDGEVSLDQLVEIGTHCDDIEEPTDAVVDLILEHWPYGDPNDALDRRHIRDRIDHGITSAYYEAGELLSWAMVAPDGSIGYMHTLEGHRGRGLGLSVAANLTLKVWNAGLTPYCLVVHDSLSPDSVLSKLGYEASEDSFVWLGTTPR